MGVHVPKRIARLIEARAAAIGHKKSRYAAMIVEWWMDQGAPAVNRVDDNMRAEVMAQFEKDQVLFKSNTPKKETDGPRPGSKEHTKAQPKVKSSRAGTQIGVLKIVDGKVVLE